MTNLPLQQSLRCLSAYLSVCVRACMLECVRVCARACVRVPVGMPGLHACAPVCTRVRQMSQAGTEPLSHEQCRVSGRTKRMQCGMLCVVHSYMLDVKRRDIAGFYGCGRRDQHMYVFAHVYVHIFTLGVIGGLVNWVSMLLCMLLRS